MADKVYIPNLVINEISDSLIDHIADQVGNNLTVDPTNLAKLNEANTFTGLNTFNTLPQSDVTPANDKDLVTKKYVDDTANNKVSKTGPETIEGVKTFSSIPLCSQRPTNGSQLANKDYVDSVAVGGDSIPLTISNQMATYDATTLNSVKWDFGSDTYSILGTNEIDFTTKTSRLDKTSNVIIGDAGCYAIPDELIPLFGDSLKEMGSIPIGLNVMSSNSNIGGLGIGGNGNASVLWGGGSRNFLALIPNQVILSGDSASGNAGLSIVNGVVVFNSPISFNFNLGDSGTLTMSPKMISELKRLLGIS